MFLIILSNDDHDIVSKEKSFPSQKKTKEKIKEKQV